MQIIAKNKLDNLLTIKKRDVKISTKNKQKNPKKIYFLIQKKKYFLSI